MSRTLTSDTSIRAQEFVAERLAQARGLGAALSELIEEPEEFVVVLRDGLTRLADPAYASEQERVAPGSGLVFGVRSPLLTATMRQLRPALQRSSPAAALWLAERLATEEEREFVFFCQLCLKRSLPNDPERSWQLMRRLARQASDWIRVDSLAELYARGILAEAFRWAELEQLVYSSDRWERRLVGSTIARLPYELPRQRRAELQTAPGLTIIKSLIGDAAPDVRKALSWALRSWLEVDRQGVRALMRDEADAARRGSDGQRAWVLRDALTAPTLDAAFAAEIRARLDGVRRQPGQSSTSVAAEVARGFAGLDQLTERAISQQGVRQGRESALSGATGPRRG